MIHTLYNYIIECNGCGSTKEISTIYKQDGQEFSDKILQKYGWNIIKTAVMTPRDYFGEWEYRVYCFDTPCQVMEQMYIENQQK